MSDPGLFALWVRERRKELDLTQEALAQRAGLSASAVWKIEVGQRKPSLEAAQMLAEALRVGPQERARFLRLARGVSEREEAAPNNLPAQLTPLLGREAELVVLTDLLAADGVRLVTVTGPPGIGKTRLALAAAERMVGNFPDGVFMVSLAPVLEGSGVMRAIAGVLGLRDSRREALSITVREHLQSKNMLLLLDNFEQVISAATMVSDLLERCPNLKALVTSREALRLRGERQVQVRPLATPDPLVPASPDGLIEYAAVRLFVDRARDVASGFSLTRQNAGAVVAICNYLEGVPLAIELVAARTRLLPPSELLSRLEGHGKDGVIASGRGSSLQVLTSGARDLPERHRTLRNAISWSYNLLIGDERLLFTRLGVFVGGCSLSTAEAVCNADGDVEQPVLDVALSLLQKSLLKGAADEESHESRFSMLETVCEFAREQLEASGEEELARQRHAEYFLALARATESQLVGADQQIWLDRLERDHDNIRAALGWLVTRGSMEIAATLAGPLARFWMVHGHLGEGRAWLDLLLKADLSPQVRAKALEGAGLLARNQGDFDAASAMLQECLEIRKQWGDRRDVAAALKDLGTVFDYKGDMERAEMLYRQSLEMYRGLEDWWGVAACVNNLGILATIAGHREVALDFYKESLQLRRRIGDKSGVAATLNNLGLTYYHMENHGEAVVLWEETLPLVEELGDRAGVANVLGHLGRAAYVGGDYARASYLLGRSLAVRRALGDKHGTALTLSYLSDAALMRGNYGEAASLLEECLLLVKDMGVRLNVIEAVENFAKLAALTHESERATRLFAAAACARRDGNMPSPPARESDMQKHRDLAREGLIESTWTGEWHAGEGMSLDEAAAYALSAWERVARKPG
ncbi:MAG: tetratricopeptide repeat protein [Chloroflexota bacterium]|nr:tetratricopeptide repeat protein [Chloroflexota bacterium]